MHDIDKQEIREYLRELRKTERIMLQVFQKNTVYGQFIFPPLDDLKRLHETYSPDSVEHSIVGEVITALEDDDEDTLQYFRTLIYQLSGTMDALQYALSADGDYASLKKHLDAGRTRLQKQQAHAIKGTAMLVYTRGMVRELTRLLGEV